MAETEIIAVAHDQMTHYKTAHDYYIQLKLPLPAKTYPVKKPISPGCYEN
jgi:hypothetical protein